MLREDIACTNDRSPEKKKKKNITLPVKLSIISDVICFPLYIKIANNAGSFVRVTEGVCGVVLYLPIY